MSNESRPGKIERLTPVIVPAHPGWHSLQAIWSQDEKRYVEFWHETVIAWSVQLVRRAQGEWITHAYPVLAEGSGDSDDALRRPDGRITVRGEADFDAEEAALDYLNEQDRENRQRAS